MNKEEKVKTVNPATEEVLNEYRDYDQTTADKLQGKKSTKRIDEWEKDNDKRMQSSNGGKFEKCHTIM